jgi:hypothetical protein
MKKWGRTEIAVAMSETNTVSGFPTDPLDYLKEQFDLDARRLSVQGILESYHSNYDAISEALQNAVDSLEDAKLEGLTGPYQIEVTINLAANSFSVLDTGVGMPPNQLRRAFAPHATFKQQTKRDHKSRYRGYKGVGLTFLAYGTDDITIHSKQEKSEIVKARMQYGRAWASGERPDTAMLNYDHEASPLDSHSRGTYLKVQFSQYTHPRSLLKLASNLGAWKTILQTKTAIGQILLDRKPIVDFKVKLKLIGTDGSETQAAVDPEFLYPSTVKRKSPPFRFLDLVSYHETYSEVVEPPAEKLRQDGLYLVWDSARITKELTDDQQKEFKEQIQKYTPYAYAFVPYQGSVWAELNQIETTVRSRSYLIPGLIIGVNRQRLADNITEIKATRFEEFGRNALVIVHFDGVKPDQGRKTVEIEAEELAKRIADRVVQYLGKQRKLLRPAGESPTPQQREVEKNHADWLYNVRKHAENNPLHIPPVAYLSTPQEEQDVVGLFHQLAALGVFPGIKIYATSQRKTYDCLVEFECDPSEPGLSYSEQYPLGLSPYVLGDGNSFSTKQLTVEFKNNLDGLIADLDGTGPKTFAHIDICICWGMIDDSFAGYTVEPVIEARLDERRYPGVTHILRHNSDAHVVGVIMLETITRMILAGQMIIPVAG